MPEEHPVGVQRPLGGAGGAGGVDHQGRVVGPRVEGGKASWGLGHEFGGADRLARGTVDADHEVEIGQVGPDRRELGETRRVGDEHPRARIREAVAQGVRAEQAGERQGDAPELVGRRVGDHHGGGLGQQHADPVAGGDATGAQGRGEPVGLRAQLPEGRLRDGPAEDLLDRDAVGFTQTPTVADIHADIVSVGNVPSEAGDEPGIVDGRTQHGRGLRPRGP